MSTDDLIATLTRDLAPIPAGGALRPIVLWTVVGALTTTLVLSITLGLRHDIDSAMAGMMFWMKIAYTASLALVAIAGAVVLARPEALPPRWLWLLAVPVAALAGIAVIELGSAPSDLRMGIWLGRTWQVCPSIIVMLSLPIMAALMVAYRRYAPSQLRITGAVIGLGAGAAAATVYCLHCPEATATFVLSWYSLGIAMATAIGASVGPRLLRW